MQVSALRLRIGKGKSPLRKNKRFRAVRMNTNKYAVPAKIKDKPQNKSSRKRAPYFRYYREERVALTVLENTYLSKVNRKEYRAARYLYYFVIPHLARYLWWDFDRTRLVDVEHDYYNMLLAYRNKRGRYEEPYRVPVHLIKYPIQ